MASAGGISEALDQYKQANFEQWEENISIDVSGSGAATLIPAASGLSWNIMGYVLCANSATGIQFSYGGTTISGNMSFGAGDKIVVGYSGHVVLSSGGLTDGLILALDGASDVTGHMRVAFYRDKRNFG